MENYSSALSIALDESKVENGPKRYAEMFPYEIWMECFLFLNMRDRKNVSRTCHLFRDICLPFLLRSITYSLKLSFHRFSSMPWMADQLDEFQDHEVTFLRLVEDDEKRRLVRKLTLAYFLKLASHTDEVVAKSAKEAYDMYLELLVSCAPLLCNLREVVIRFNRNLDKKLVSALAKLPELEQISFFSVKFGAHVSKPLIKARKILIDNTDGHDSNPIKVAKRLELFSGDNLEELTVFSPVYASKLFRAFSSQDPLRKLTRLSFQLHESNITILESFLAQCPRLISIKADFGNRYSFRPGSITPSPRSAVPLLKSLEGYDQEIKYFVPGRPVRNVVLVPTKKWIGPSSRSDEEVRQLLTDLSESTGPVYDLQIATKPTAELLASITNYLPQLSRLGMKLASNTELLPFEDPYNISFDEDIVDQILPKASCDKEAYPIYTRPFSQLYLFTAYMASFPSGLHLSEI